ncbi:MAG: hypothetical protein AAF389_01750 [Gemmatimonadota bacterium]
MVPSSTSESGLKAHDIDAPFRLRLLGPWSLEGPDGQQINSVLAQPKRLCLLAYLALKAEPITRATIVALFWPERDEERARNSLAQALFYLRRSMGKSLVENLPGDRIRISDETVWFDAREVLAGGMDPPEGTLDFFPGWNADSSQPLQEWLDEVRRRCAAIEDTRREATNPAPEVEDLGGPTPSEPRSAKEPSWVRWSVAATAALLVLVMLNAVRSGWGEASEGAAVAAEPSPVSRLADDTRATEGGREDVAPRPTHLAVLRPRVDHLPDSDSTFVYAVLTQLTHQLSGMLSEPDRVVSLRYTDSPADINAILPTLGLESEVQRVVEVFIVIGPDSVTVNGTLLSGSGYVVVQETTAERYLTPEPGALSIDLPLMIARDIAGGLATPLSR